MILAAVLGIVVTASAAGDVMPPIGSRVRIEATSLHAGWHEGLLNHLRVPARCYVVLVFKPRAAASSTMEVAHTVQMADVSRLEVFTGPSRLMQAWVGLRDAVPESDWRAVAPAAVEAAAGGCPTRSSRVDFPAPSAS